MIQQFFKTGKTIVIDDQYEEARPLLDALSKNHIPYVYSQGKPNSDFPLPSLCEFYNLMFLDLNLDFKFSAGGLSENDEKTFKSTHLNLIETLLKNSNRSFVIIIWSNEEENYLESFMKIFSSTEKYRTNKLPYKVISLSKPDFFVKEGENYKFQPGKEDELKERINTELKDLEAFKLFCEWDGIISNAAGNLVDDFMGLINPISDGSDTEAHLAKALTCLAVAYNGEDRYLSLSDDKEKTKSVLYVLSQMLVDDIDKNVYEGNQTHFKQWASVSDKKEIGEIKKEINYPLLNRKLLQFKTNQDYLINAVYFSGSSANHNAIFVSIFKGETKNTKRDALEIYKNENNGVEPASLESFNANLKNYIISRISEIEIDVTPACDISNDKAPIHRLVIGFAIPSYLIDFFNLKQGSLFVSPNFEVDKSMINKEPEAYTLVLDFRYLTTKQKKDLKLTNYLFSLRTNLVNDIQIQLASHVSRLGTLNL